MGLDRNKWALNYDMSANFIIALLNLLVRTHATGTKINSGHALAQRVGAENPHRISQWLGSIV